METARKTVRTWRDVPGWFDFDDIYTEAVAEALGRERPSHFVELGTAFGRSAIFMGQWLRANGAADRVTFDAIDLWAPEWLPEDDGMRRMARAMGGVKEAFLWYLRDCGIADIVNAIQCDQLKAAEFYSAGALDLVFLDTCHSEKGTCAAIDAWLPKVRPGGVFAGHDHTPDWPGVIKAVASRLPGAVQRRSSFYWRVPG